MMRFAVISPLALAACAPPVPMAEDLIPDYLGVETTVLDVDLVQFNVAMTKAVSERDVRNYADCAAAAYTLIVVLVLRGICAQMYTKRVACGRQMLFTPSRQTYLTGLSKWTLKSLRLLVRRAEYRWCEDIWLISLPLPAALLS